MEKTEHKNSYNNYLDEDVEKAFEHYLRIYKTKIPWETILLKVLHFVKNREHILAFDYADWLGFLFYLGATEKTIGLFGYTSKGIFHRIFTMFGRAYLEEKYTIHTKRGKEIGLRWEFPDSEYFKGGEGKVGDIDLVDDKGIHYDVKNDYAYLDRAHNADYLLVFKSSTGIIELHEKPTDPTKGSYIEIFDETIPLDKIVKEDYGLDPLLFDKNSSEEDIERYLGYLI
ncbi:MAG: hypothetical protein J6Z11_14945 [Candidatus Riflebacteria bacterium]|nr:hypothetical protein [Candidatus Riflebacteria bacterium]